MWAWMGWSFHAAFVAVPRHAVLRQFRPFLWTVDSRSVM
nr:hypothetical protein JVH1_9333 [Rhodococcus sp. JVH1]